MIPEHARPLIASRQAETAYVRDLRNIARQVAKAVAKGLEKHLRIPESAGRVVRVDAAGRISPQGETVNVLGLKVQTHVREETGRAFDRMAKDVDSKNAQAMKLVGIGRSAGVPGVPVGPPKGLSPAMLRAMRALKEGDKEGFMASSAPTANALWTRGLALRPDRASGQKAWELTPKGHAALSPPGPTISVAPVIDTFRDANIKLMEKAGAAYVDQVRAVLENPENEGLRVEELADKFTAIAEGMDERGDVFASRAELIARDQTLKLNANLSQARMQNAGVTRYTWSTSQDERVRPLHAALEGQEFSFDDPPATDEEGNKNNPGEDFQCRCIALPVLPDFDDL